MSEVQKKMHKYKKNEHKFTYRLVFRVLGCLEWQEDLLRFLPKGQGDIKYQHVFSSQNKKRVCQNADTPSLAIANSSSHCTIRWFWTG